jgi:hypothetical protein
MSSSWSTRACGRTVNISVALVVLTFTSSVSASSVVPIPNLVSWLIATSGRPLRRLLAKFTTGIMAIAFVF